MNASILIIDDSEDDQRLYQLALKELGCSLEMASSAEAGFACIAHSRPDLILLDYNLPDMDGLSFIKRLAEIAPPAIPIVMLTGEESTEVAVEVMKHGADDYLVKDLKGQYLKLLPGVARHVLSAHAQREQSRLLKKRTEALLLRNQVLMQNSMDGIHVLDVQGNLVDFNDAFCRMLGYTREEMADFIATDWAPEFSGEELRARLKDHIGKSLMIETMHRRKDGSLINVEISIIGMAIEGQNLVFASSRDITERKKNEAELKLGAQLLNSTSDSVFLFDLDGNFVYLNEAAWKSRGYTRDEMMAMKLRDLNTPEFAQLVAARIKELMGNGQGIYEAAHICKDGSIMPVEISSRTVEYGGRKLVLATIRDITERKEHEAILRWHKRVIDTSLDGFWVNDLQGNLLEANEAYAKMSGYSVKEQENMHVSQLEDIEQSEDVAAHTAKIIAQGHDRFITRHRRKDGHEIDVDVSVTYMAEPPQIVAFFRDITERIQAEKRIAYSESLYHGLFENMSSGVAVYYAVDEGEDFIFSDFNRASELLGKVKREDVIGKRLTVCFPGVKEFGLFEVLQRVWKTGKPEHFHDSLYKDDRIFGWLENYVYRLPSGEVVAVYDDVTARKQAQEALAKSGANMRAMMDNSPYLTWMKDTEGRYLMINKVFADYLRLQDAEQAIGKTDLDLNPKELADKYRADDAEVMSSRLQKHVEESAFDGKNTHWVETYKTPITDTHGNVLGTVGFAKDITERKQSERVVREAMNLLEKKELAKTRFLAAAGHDLRQPLAAANLYLDTLRLTGPTPDQNEIISRMGKAMETFKMLLDALLNISKLDSGAIKPEYASISASELIIWLEENFSAVAREKQLDFRLFFSLKEKLVVRSDIALVRAIMMNLVSNAIKFTQEGAILVSARRRGGDVLFQIWDTGIGIPEDHIDHIFDEFYQINNPQRDRTSGLGLGLAITERALALLSQKIECRSKVGRGSVFGFRLPLDPTPSGGTQEFTQLALQEGVSNDLFARGKHFVVLEDDALVAQAMFKALKMMGGKVECFDSAEDALLHADTLHTDYYIVDFMLRGKLNGIQFLNRLSQKQGKPVHAVLVTGDTSSTFVRSMKDCNWPVLHKPANMSELLACLGAQTE